MSVAEWLLAHPAESALLFWLTGVATGVAFVWRKR